jgi:hypothetical protein
MNVISLREFARRIGVSLPAVQRAAKPETGRIEAIRDPATGKITGIDWDTQQHAWSANSKHPQKIPHHRAGGRPRKDGTPTAAPSTPAREIDDAPPSPGGMSMSEIQRARELVKLQIDNEKLKEVRGETIAVSQVKQAGAKLAATIINGLYNIPERCADDIAGMSDPHEIHKLLVREIDATVNELRAQYGY